MSKLKPAAAALLLLSLAAPALARGGAGLSAKQLAVLHATRVPALLPADLPGGFRPAELVTHLPADERGPGGGASYLMLYDGPDDQGFAIESAAGGIGDLITEAPPRLELKLPALGPDVQTTLYFARFGNDPGNSWLSTWIASRGGFYRLAGTGFVRSTLDPEWFPRKEISLATAKQVLLSLRAL